MPDALLGFLLSNPLVRACVEHIEWQRTTVEHGVVKLADVEFGAKLFLSAFAKFPELQLAKLVAEGLGRPRDVAVGFTLDGGFVDRSGFAEKIHDLITAPSLGVD